MTASQAICRMCEVIRRQHKALATEESYTFWLRRYMRALPEMPPDLSSEKKLETFLTDMALRGDVSASTQNQAFNAILFFYREVLGQSIGNVNALRAKRPVQERHTPTVSETQLLLQTIRNEGAYPTHLIARMLYGYATHCLERGTNPRAIQRVMGHKYLETTMGYLHADALSVRSPLEELVA